MLKSLSIENIAVIEKADIDFSDGLNVLTGETGAGKSIIVDSINAILGERTSKELVRHNADSAVVTALFEDVNHIVDDRLEELGINSNDDGTLLLSRRISSQGKSSCRVNGTVCTVSMLKEIGSVLVNIHGQHDSQALLNPEHHYQFIDMLGDDKKIYDDYKQHFKKLLAIRKRLKSLTADADTKDKELEILDYQIKELTDADIKDGEWEELKKRKNIILNSQLIVNALNHTISAINGSDEAAGISTMLMSSEKEIDSIKDIDSDLKGIYDKIQETLDNSESLKDLITSKLETIDYSDEELERIEERLNLLYLFSNKYGETEKDMLNYLENAVSKRNSIVNSDTEIEKLNLEYDDIFDKTVKAADILSCYRKSIAYQLEQDVKQQLEFLDMPKIEFKVHFEKGNLSSNGYDKIEFLISTNVGEPEKPLAKIASGGELSRIMLAIKNIVAQKDTVDTLIFDEIDTGVSGRASRKIGLKLKSVSNHTQVICVTHSAQIASVADNHLLIEKDYRDDKTYTSVTSLGFEQRKNELARIMGGIEITDTLLKSAEELLLEGKE